jgi:hypothetical protein
MPILVDTVVNLVLAVVESIKCICVGGFLAALFKFYPNFFILLLKSLSLFSFLLEVLEFLLVKQIFLLYSLSFRLNCQ